MCYNVVKKEPHKSNTVSILCRHRLDPFCKIVDNDNDITMPLCRARLHVMKSMTHLENGPLIIIGCRGVGEARCLQLKIWHSRHFQTTRIQSLNI